MDNKQEKNIDNKQEKKKVPLIKRILKIIIIIAIVLFIAVVCFIIINNARINSIIDKVLENEDLTFKVVLNYHNQSQGLREYYNSKDITYVDMNLNDTNSVKFYNDKNNNITVMLSMSGENKVANLNQNGINMGEYFYIVNNFNVDSFYMLSTDFSIKNLFMCVGNFFLSAKLVSEETLDGVECYKIRYIWPAMDNYSMYITKYDYMIKKISNDRDDSSTNVDIEYDFNVDQSVFEFPDLTDYYVVMN